MIAQLTTNGGPPITIQNDLPTALYLPREQIEQVTRVVQEGLLNALNHAGASQIHVHLHHTERETCITIQDDGHGFDPNQSASDNRDHFGLKIMRARAIRIGGQVSITSSPGQGTTIQLSWPIVAGETDNLPEGSPEPIIMPQRSQTDG